jgi:hypothetical protein
VETSLSHVEKIIWMGVRHLGMGFMTYKGCIVSFMDASIEGVMDLHFQCILFPSPCISIDYVKCFHIEAKVGLLPKHERNFPC